MSNWPQRWEQDQLVNKTKARLEQDPLNLTPSQAETSYQGSMAGTQDDDAVSSRVSMYSYRTNDKENLRFVKEVDGRVSFSRLLGWFVTIYTNICEDHQCPERPILSSHW